MKVIPIRLGIYKLSKDLFPKCLVKHFTVSVNQLFSPDSFSHGIL